MQGIAIDIAWRTIVAFALVAFLVPAVLPLSRRLGLFDAPGGRKQHEEPTSYVGGLCILLAVTVSFLLFDREFNRVGSTFLACSFLLALVGFVDDRIGLSSRIRFAAQASAALIMIFVAGVQAQNMGDVVGQQEFAIGWLAVPFTIFVVVGVTNALNMIDGSDGLAGGQVLVSLVLLAAFALYAGNSDMLLRLLTVAAAVAGFLVWNLRFPWQPRARIFLGNAGSMVLGFTIAWAAVRLTQTNDHPVPAVLGPWTIAIPLIDCISLMFRRICQGRSPFRADRNHLHHMLLDAGFKPAAIAWGLMAVSLALGLAAGVAVQQGAYRPTLVLVFLVLLVAYHLLTEDRALAVALFRQLHWRQWGADGRAASLRRGA
jgi:UDP-GlcNAc:undecaprenyl-phosphate GlcNAc-1-phosphate transferase